MTHIAIAEMLDGKAMMMRPRIEGRQCERL